MKMNGQQVSRIDLENWSLKMVIGKVAVTRQAIYVGHRPIIEINFQYPIMATEDWRILHDRALFKAGT